MTASFRLCLFVVLPAVFLLSVSSADAQSRRRGNSRGAAMAKAARAATIKAAQAQYAQGEAVLSIAMSNGSGAESRLAAVIGKMQASVTDLKQAQSQEVDLKKELVEIEKEILREQSNDSAYSLAHNVFDTCRAEIQALETKLLSATDYVAKKATLAKQSDGPAAVATLRKDTLEAHPEYTALQLKVDEAATNLAKIKRELFANDNEWKDTHEQMLAARKDASESTSDVYRAAPERADPLRDIKDAKQAAAAARMVMAQAEAVLKQYNAPTKPATATASKTKK